MGTTETPPRRASPENPLRIAVLISGGGSGLLALLKYQSEEIRCHKTVLVLSDKEDAGGLEHGRNKGITTKAIPLPPIRDKKEQRSAHEELVQKELENSQVEFVVLSGYMRIFTPWFVRIWKGRMVNIHPSLLPHFPGAHPHRDVISSGVSTTGCTVHLVDEGVDTGPIIAQREAPVLTGDNEFSLQERVKNLEHELYPETIDKYCSGKIIL